MKIFLSIILISISIIVNAQDLPKLINPQDTLILNGDTITGKELWIQTTDTEIEQRFTIKESEKRISELEEITKQIDSTQILITQVDSNIIDQKDNQIGKAESSIVILGGIVKDQNTEVVNLRLDLVKQKNKTNWWRTSAIVLGAATLTGIITIVSTK